MFFWSQLPLLCFTFLLLPAILFLDSDSNNQEAFHSLVWNYMFSWTLGRVSAYRRLQFHPGSASVSIFTPKVSSPLRRAARSIVKSEETRAESVIQGHGLSSGKSLSVWLFQLPQPGNAFKMKLPYDVGRLFHLLARSLRVMRPKHKGRGACALWKSTPFFVSMNRAGCLKVTPRRFEVGKHQRGEFFHRTPCFYRVSRRMKVLGTVLLRLLYFLYKWTAKSHRKRRRE